jgi:hypothetical protein
MAGHLLQLELRVVEQCAVIAVASGIALYQHCRVVEAHLAADADAVVVAIVDQLVSLDFPLAQVHVDIAGEFGHAIGRGGELIGGAGDVGAKHGITEALESAGHAALVRGGRRGCGRQQHGRAIEPRRSARRRDFRRRRRRRRRG